MAENSHSIDINQTIINMKTTKLFQSIFLFSLFLCGLAACSEDDAPRLSPIQETTMEGDASTLQIDLTRSDWRIASVTDLNGYPPIGSNTQLEGPGTVDYGWATIKREKENTLIIETEDNFDGTERSFIINLEMKTGFYKEQIVIHQKICENLYRIESIEYSVEEGDGVEEAGTKPDKSTYKDENLGNTTGKHDYYPFINEWTEYAFIPDDHSDEIFKGIDPEKRSIYLPERIEDGKVIVGQQQLFFINQGKYYKEDELRYKHFEVDIVGMKWNIYTSTIYYKQLQVTFTATLSRPGSDTKKISKGKFTQRYPYGCSEIHHEVKDSLED